MLHPVDGNDPGLRLWHTLCLCLKSAVTKLAVTFRLVARSFHVQSGRGNDK
jgi:hypothetical protein